MFQIKLNHYFQRACLLLLTVVIFQNVGCGDSGDVKTQNADTGSTYSDGISYDEQGRLIITQYEISWKFDADYSYGNYANGDFYVVDPGTGVSIIEISPGSQKYNGYDVHGSEKNPVAGVSKQGYDSQLGRYDETINAGLNVSLDHPLMLSAKDCIISSISNTPPETHTYGGQETVMKTCAILTVVGSAPPTGTFRPSYCDRDHSTLYNIGDLDYTLLAKLTPVSGEPSIKDVEAMFERLWLDNFPGWASIYYKPLHMPNYGREIASELGLGAVMLHIDLPDSEKETLLIRLVQIGIDLYGVLVNGGKDNWGGDGGHGKGRKWPILFSGLMLGDTDMQNIGQKSGDYLYGGSYGPGNPPPDYYHFGEDDQTFYVAAEDVSVTNSSSWNPDERSGTAYPYTSAMIGMPEWGIRHQDYPEMSDSAWYAIYRRCCNAMAWQGQLLSCVIMGAKPLWNHNALFDYMDRYMAITNGEPDPFGFSVQGVEAGWRSNNTWLETMWDMYRKDY